MSTRSATLTFIDGSEYYRHYRHYDGYLEGHGNDLANLLIKCSSALPSQWDDTYLTEMRDVGCELEEDYIEHSDIEYLYRTDKDTLTNTVGITIWAGRFNESYAQTMKHTPIFNGTPEELLTQLGKPIPETPKPTKRFDIALKEVEGNLGLTSADCTMLSEMIDDKTVYPLDIPSHNVESSAIGFISAKLAAELNFEYNTINRFVEAIIDDIEKESSDNTYMLNDTRIYLTR